MPRYFFDVRNHITASDLDGRELPDLETAIAEARKDITDIMRARFDTINNWATWSIEIRDETRLLLRVPFSSS
jgi:hypothetical protein